MLGAGGPPPGAQGVTPATPGGRSAVRAVALRAEALDDRWRVCALEIG